MTSRHRRNWHRRNSGIHFLDPQVDLSTAHGRAFLQMSAVWAEFSSALHSERMREVNAQAKRQGRSLNGRGQYGWKWTSPTATTPQPDYEERAVMSHILWLRDECRLSWRKVADAVESRLAAKEGAPPYPGLRGQLGSTLRAHAVPAGLQRGKGAEPGSG
jgi:DNA invertase Pin-like site-specific DNA recombinase